MSTVYTNPIAHLAICGSYGKVTVNQPFTTEEEALADMERCKAIIAERHKRAGVRSKTFYLCSFCGARFWRPKDARDHMYKCEKRPFCGDVPYYPESELMYNSTEDSTWMDTPSEAGKRMRAIIRAEKAEVKAAKVQSIKTEADA